MNKLLKLIGIIFTVIISIQTIVLTIMAIIGSINQTKIRPDFDKKLELRQEVVEKIERGEILLDNKRAILPEEYKEVAEGGYVYVYVANEEETVIEFIYRGGFPDEGQSFIYSSGGEELLKKYIHETNYYWIERYKDNWYFVQFR